VTAAVPRTCTRTSRYCCGDCGSVGIATVRRGVLPPAGMLNDSRAKAPSAPTAAAEVIAAAAGGAECCKGRLAEAGPQPPAAGATRVGGAQRPNCRATCAGGKLLEVWTAACQVGGCINSSSSVLLVCPRLYRPVQRPTYGCLLIWFPVSRWHHRLCWSARALSALHKAPEPNRRPRMASSATGHGLLMSSHGGSLGKGV
jgi:hypothetical protein